MQHETIIEINEHNIQTVLTQSRELPVLFYFWSERDPESAKQTALVSKIAVDYADKFILATLNCDKQPMLAAQFGLQMLPTFYLFKNGQPVDGLQGAQNEDSLRQLLQIVLPNDNEIKLDEARRKMEQGDYDKAIVLLKALRTEWPNDAGLPRSEISLLLTRALLELKQVTEAKEILKSIAEKDRNPEYQELNDRIELLTQAAHSPEIERLQKQFKKNPNNSKYRIALALKMQEVGRHEDALKLLFEPLECDLTAGDGAIKKAFMDILSVLGTSNPLASQYRRKLYTLMY